MMVRARWWWLVWVALLLAACSPAGSERLPWAASWSNLTERLPRGAMPRFAQEKGPEVEALYRFALENQETLQYIPCYCGCKPLGHRSNRDCYVTENHQDGTVTFTAHAAT